MARKIEIGFSTPGAEQTMANFDKLTRKEQEAVIEGSKLGAQWEKNKRKANQLGTAGARAFKDIAGAVVGVSSVVGALTKALDLTKREYERIIDLQNKALGTQLSYNDAIGNFKNNNAQAIIENKKLLEQVKQFSVAQGARISGGPAEVISAITDVRSKAGEGFTLDQQFGAVAQAIEAKILDPAVNLAEIASANLRTQKALGISERQAQNVLTGFGPLAGGDVNAFVGEFGALAGSIKGLREIEEKRFGQAQTTLTDVLALEGFLSQQLGMSPEETTTIVTNILGKIDNARVGQKGFQFQSQNAIERLGELADAVLSGKVAKEDRQKLLTSAGLKGAMGQAVLGVVGGEGDQLAAGRSSLQKLMEQQQTINSQLLAQRTEEEKRIAAGRAITGGRAATEITETELGERAQTREDIAKIREGLTDFDLRRLPGQLINDLLVTTGAIGRERVITSEVLSSVDGLTGPSDVSPQRLQELDNILSEFNKRLEKTTNSFGEAWYKVVEVAEANKTKETP